MTKREFAAIKELITKTLDTYRYAFSHKEAAQAAVDCLLEIEKRINAELTGTSK